MLTGLRQSAPLVVVGQVVAVVAHAFPVVALVLVRASPRSLLDCLGLGLHLHFRPLTLSTLFRSDCSLLLLELGKLLVATDLGQFLRVEQLIDLVLVLATHSYGVLGTTLGDELLVELESGCCCPRWRPHQVFRIP